MAALQLGRTSLASKFAVRVGEKRAAHAIGVVAGSWEAADRRMAGGGCKTALRALRAPKSEAWAGQAAKFEERAQRRRRLEPDHV